MSFGIANGPVAIFHGEGRDDEERADIGAIRAESRERILTHCRSDGARAFARRGRSRLRPDGRRLCAAG